MIGDGSRVSEKVGIKRSVIGNHCVIGEKVKITNSVIMDHVTIEEGYAQPQVSFAVARKTGRELLFHTICLAAGLL